MGILLCKYMNDINSQLGDFTKYCPKYNNKYICCGECLISTTCECVCSKINLKCRFKTL